MRREERRASLRYIAVGLCAGLFSVIVSTFFPYVFENRTLVVAIAAVLVVMGTASVFAFIWRAGRR